MTRSLQSLNGLRMHFGSLNCLRTNKAQRPIGSGPSAFVRSHEILFANIGTKPTSRPSNASSRDPDRRC